jgi:hypothetical protein
MRNFLRICMLFLALSGPTLPCISPANIEGVAFTAGESLDLGRLTALGIEGVNYSVDGKAPGVGIRYISHYDPQAMVYIGTYGMSYQNNLPLQCMGVVVPVDSPYQHFDTTQFHFSRAVRRELEWLAGMQVIAISADTIRRIDSILSGGSNGGIQYWTHAGTALGYNSWYEYDTLHSSWGGGSGVNGVDGLKTVRGVYDVTGCSLVKPGSGMPQRPLGISKGNIEIYAFDDSLDISRINEVCQIRPDSLSQWQFNSCPVDAKDVRITLTSIKASRGVLDLGHCIDTNYVDTVFSVPTTGLSDSVPFTTGHLYVIKTVENNYALLQHTFSGSGLPFKAFIWAYQPDGTPVFNKPAAAVAHSAGRLNAAQHLRARTTAGGVAVEWQRQPGEAHVQIHDIRGRLIAERSCDALSGAAMVPIGGKRTPAQIYCVRIVLDRSVITTRIMALKRKE